MDPATVKDWEEALQKGDLEPEDRIFWAEEREKYLDLIRPPEVQGPPPPPKTWVDYARGAFGRIGEGATTVDPMGGSQPTIPPSTDPATGEPLAPGEVSDWVKRSDEGSRYGARLALEHSPDVLSMLHPFTATYALLQKAPWLISKMGPMALRALQYGLAQEAATRTANVVDPTNYTDPNVSAAYTVGGEMLGRAATKVPEWGLTKFYDAWKSTPYQADVVEQVEKLGGRTTLGMGSEKAWPQWSDVGLTHAPLGGRMRNIYDASKKLIDDALEGVRARHPSGKVDEAVHQGSRAVQRQAVPTALDDVPRGVRKTTQEVIDATNLKHHQSYEALDNVYRQYQVPWSQSQAQLPAVTKAEDLLTDPNLMQIHAIEPASIFHRTAALVEEMRQLPPTVTLDELITAQKKVNDLMLEGQRHVNEAYGARVRDPASWSELTTSIQKNVLGTLADTNNLLYGHLRPYMVDRGPAQEVAKKVIGNWEKSLMVPETAMQRGNPGRVGVLEDPQVEAARTLLEKPKYALFMEAHNDRALLEKIGRMKGPNMDNTIAREAKDMAKAMDTSMTATGDALTPQLTPAWRATNAAYKQDAQLLNSPLIQELAEKDLDDILLTSVMNERPNDLKAIRAFLAKHPGGGTTLDDVGEMWLTRKIMAHTDNDTKVLNLRGLRDDLNGLTRNVEKELFPGGLTTVRQKLTQGIGMEDAVAEVMKGDKSSAFKLRQLKNQVNDPALWQEVQSDFLAKILHGKEGLPLDGDHILTELGKTHHLNQVLFEPAHLKELTALAHTSRVLNQVVQSGKLAWAPMVRQIGHGVVLPGIVGGATYAVTGDPTKAVLAGGTYLLGTTGLAYVLTQPRLVPIMRRMMSTPANTRAYGELLGAFVGELKARNMGHLLQPMEGEAPAPPETAAAPPG